MQVKRTKPYYKGVSLDFTSPVQVTGKLVYEPHTTVIADGIDQNPQKDCGQGVNFCSSIAQALRWGPKVVEIFVPSRTIVIDTGDKLRAFKVLVGKEVSFSWANLSRASLSGANLSGANLSGANLREADLREANLREADLRWADLRWANLRWADLREADLRWANLSGADLRWADLNGANLRGTNLPEGFVH
jgi:uncharacterized protein YbdZ (MbtH family)